MFKYDLDSEVYYLKDNKIVIGKVIARKYSDSIEDFNIYADGLANDWIRQAIGGKYTCFYIVHDLKSKTNYQIDEKYLFTNDKDLIESLY